MRIEGADRRILQLDREAFRGAPVMGYSQRGSLLALFVLFVANAPGFSLMQKLVLIMAVLTVVFILLATFSGRFRR